MLPANAKVNDDMARITDQKLSPSVGGLSVTAHSPWDAMNPMLKDSASTMVIADEMHRATQLDSVRKWFGKIKKIAVTSTATGLLMISFPLEFTSPRREV